jgi:hypothetical protein
MKHEPRVTEPPCDRAYWHSIYVGRCPVCGTSVRADDEFVRRGGSALHAECDGHGFSADDSDRKEHLHGS